MRRSKLFHGQTLYKRNRLIPEKIGTGPKNTGQVATCPYKIKIGFNFIYWFTAFNAECLTPKAARLKTGGFRINVGRKESNVQVRKK